jgi:hypothetical protein
MFKKVFLLGLILIFMAMIGGFFIIKNGPKIPQNINMVTKNTPKKCPDGFIPVSDFCVMKYDAKCTNTDPKCVTSEGVYKNNAPGCACQGNFKVVSGASGAPITFIPEDDGTSESAKAYCKNAGWHLMTNDEWMTIAKSVSKVSTNWCNKDGTDCSNTPGTPGKILANGHNDTVPNKALPAGSDSEPCFGTTSDGSNICGSKGSQKRTLTLENGEIIWDFAGNVWQWVDGVIARKDEPRSLIPNLGGNAWVWAEFQTVPQNDSYSPINPNWNSKNGVGRIFHYNSLGDSDSTLYTYIRGGNWRHGADSGAFTIHMQPVPGKTNIDDIGFRCVTNP